MYKKALGKGLDALLPESALHKAPGQTEVIHVPVDQVWPNRFQPRSIFPDSDLAELAESIKQNGVLQPVLLRRKGDGAYELIAGERRWRAAKSAGLGTVPALVRNVSDEMAMIYALVENLQRQDLNPMESARAYQRLMAEFGLTQEEVAQYVGKDRSSVANIARLVHLPNEIQQLIEAGHLTAGHAKVLLGCVDAAVQLRLAHKMVNGQWTVRQAERALGSARRAARQGRHVPSRSPYPDLQERLQRQFAARVEITKTRRGGKVVLHYANSEELDRIVQMLLG